MLMMSFTFMFSYLLLIFSYKYMLILLMLMELVVVNISLMIFFYFSVFEMEFYLIYYLIFSVCEGVLGLGILVHVVRYYGSDLYYSVSMSKF